MLDDQNTDLTVSPVMFSNKEWRWQPCLFMS
nr:MAG TPA: hypothetical protein [Caudoviricetes sp.]